MKKFKLLSICLSVLMICSLVACSSNKLSSNSSSTSGDITKFVVGFDAEYPPYGYKTDDGSYEGFDLDLAKEVCNRLEMEFVAQPIDWDSKDLELNSGNIDCIWNGFTVTGRENDYTWSVPYVDNSIVFVVKSDSDIKNKTDLKDKVVMTQAGSSALAALNDTEDNDTVELVKSFKSLEQCADYNNGFMSLESGMVDCLVVDIGVAKYKLANSNNKFTQLSENLSTEQYAIGFKKGNTELKDKIEKTVIEMYKDGTFMNIANKYKDYSLTDMICLGEYINND